MSSTSLPPFAPFPTAAWKELLSIDEWNASLGAWISLAEAHLSLSDAELSNKTLRDESVPQFLASFMRELASHGSAQLGSSTPAKLLLKDCFLLAAKILKLSSPDDALLKWEFLSDFSRVYSKKRVGDVLSHLSKPSQEALETSLAALKKFLIRNLDEGLKGDLKAVEERLARLNHLINTFSSAASFFLAGSEFLDGLITCFRIMNPPLREVIVTTTYLSLTGLTECDPPKFSMLIDQLYSLKTAAEAHKAGPLKLNDSLVAELVSTTPLLQQIEHKLESSGTDNARAKNVLKDLATFKKPGAGMKPRRLIRRKIDKGKGKGKAPDDREGLAGEVHVHRMSQITQVQDLFPELGSGFVSRLLNEYGDDTEQVIAHLLDDSLPSNLKGADRSEQLYVHVHVISHYAVDSLTRHRPSTNAKPRRRSSLLPRSTPPLIPTRRNVFDDDELDRLAVDTSRLHIGKKAPERTADDILADRSTAPKKAAILAALAAFDSDDDERDDTYDAADVGGTVDTATTADEPVNDNEQALWKAYQADAKAFDRDQATRRGATRSKLKLETGMTDEAIEGWAVMLSRNANQLRRLEMKYSAASAFTGQQNELTSTSWRANAAGSGTDMSDTDGGAGRGGRGGRARGGRGRGRGGGRGGGGNVAGPSGEHDTEQARRRKEASKSQRANHNRRDQRAKKMARGGLPG